MHAFLVITSTSLSEEEVKKVAPVERVLFSESAKIGDIRELVRKTNIAHTTKTAYVLQNFDNSSVEAQNAFLKRLEEPQENVVFILTAQNEAKLLPTITSRCQVVRVKGKRVKGERNIGIDFATISKISKREDAIAFLENLITSIHDNLPENAVALKAADTALTRIRANANPTLQLTWFLVNTS